MARPAPGGPRGRLLVGRRERVAAWPRVGGGGLGRSVRAEARSHGGSAARREVGGSGSGGGEWRWRTGGGWGDWRGGSAQAVWTEPDGASHLVKGRVSAVPQCQTAGQVR